MNWIKYTGGLVMLMLSCGIVSGVIGMGIDTHGMVGLSPLLAFWGGMLSWEAQKENHVHKTL